MRGWIYIIAGIIVALMLSQFPEFYQQYRQRLGGTLDELNRQVQALDERAANVQMTRYNYVRHLTSNPDTATKQEGEHLTHLLTRQYDVDVAIKDLDDAKVQEIFIKVIFHLDIKTAEATARDYKPALPLSIEGGLYTLIGFLFGYIFMAFLFVFLPKRVLQTEN